MKCSNPDCNRGIGLVAHRRGWLGKQRSQQTRSATTYFEWLLLQPIANPQPGWRHVSYVQRRADGRLQD
jgi:hypothetical protein